MAEREDFRLSADMRFEPDNPAVESIFLVIEDHFGKGAIKSEPDAEGQLYARFRIEADAVEARLVNWLHERLARLGKYALEPVAVDCSDSTGREADYRVELSAPVAGEARDPQASSPNAPASEARPTDTATPPDGTPARAAS